MSYLRYIFKSIIVISLPLHLLWGMYEDEEFGEKGQRGYLLYEDGKYREAAPLLKEAIDAGEIQFASFYADICLRNLDKSKHVQLEAAIYYMLAIDGGDPDVTSEIHSLSPELIDQSVSRLTRAQKLVHFWAMRDADMGYGLYISEDYKEAAPLLKRASLGNHPLAQGLFADICHRQLDGKVRPQVKAAMWYLLSAKGGNPHTYSYLYCSIPRLFETNDHEQQLRSIMGCWIMEQTLPTMKPILPGQVNNYIVFTHGRKMGKTVAQKLPYLFERTTVGMMFELTGSAHSLIDDQLVPQPDIAPEAKRCALETTPLESLHMIGHSLTPGRHGPIYMNYFRSLDKQMEWHPSTKQYYLKRPKECPRLSPIYRIFLDALHEATSSKTAKELSALSHQDFPWILAGIKFWKEKYPGRSFSFSSLSERDLLQRLEAMEDPLSDRDVTAILNHIEGKSSEWPNSDRHQVSKEFDKQMHTYFITDLSRSHPLVQSTQRRFYQKLKVQDLDCSDGLALEILKTPFMMFYCQALKLRNLKSTPQHFNALLEAQKYIFHLNLTVEFADGFKSNSTWGKKIMMLFEKLQKRGIIVNLHNSP